MKLALFFITILMTVSSTFAESLSSSCFMSEEQQRDTILSEAPKALKSQSTNECFQRLVKDELEHLKNNHSPLAKDRQGVIEELLQSAIREEDTRSIRSE